jgi:hypothetical protein
MSEYEALLSDHRAEYGQVGSHSLDAAARLSLFGRDGGRTAVLDHHQSLSYEGLEGRVVSASYMPDRDQPGYPEMIRALRALFETHQRDGRVRLEYDTRIYCGPIRTDTP